MGQPQQGPPGFFGYDLLGGLTNGTNNEKYLLCLILGALQGASGSGASGGGGLPVVPGGGVQRTLTSSAPTSGGTVSAGAKSVSFVTSNDFSGTINGAAFPTSAAKNVTPTSPADALPAIPYTISAGTLYIDVLT